MPSIARHAQCTLLIATFNVRESKIDSELVLVRADQQVVCKQHRSTDVWTLTAQSKSRGTALEQNASASTLLSLFDLLNSSTLTHQSTLQSTPS